jgi:NagD protein
MRPRPDRARASLAGVRGFVFDVDGTLALAARGHEGHRALPGARRLLRRLRARGIPFAAFTNGTIHPPHDVARSLRRAGLDLRDGELLTPARVAAELFRARGVRRVLALGGPGVVRPLLEAGIEVVKSPQRADDADAVLIGWYPEFSMKDLDAASHAVWAGASLYTASNAPYFATAEGRTLGVSGAIAAAIRSITGKKAIVVGKPAAAGLRIASRHMEVAPARLAVVGDDPALEVAMARAVGAVAVAVRTGLADTASLARLPARLRPHLVLRGVDELLRILPMTAR